MPLRPIGVRVPVGNFSKINDHSPIVFIFVEDEITSIKKLLTAPMLVNPSSQPPRRVLQMSEPYLPQISSKELPNLWPCFHEIATRHLHTSIKRLIEHSTGAISEEGDLIRPQIRFDALHERSQGH